MWQKKRWKKVKVKAKNGVQDPTLLDTTAFLHTKEAANFSKNFMF